MAGRIKLAIADDHPMVVDGLENYFKDSSQIEVVATTSHLNEVMKMISTFSPDILLMDYHFNNETLTGLDMCRAIKIEHPYLKVIIVSSFSDIPLINDFIAAGAKGYMLKTSSRQEFIDAILNVFAGGESFSKDIRELLVKERLTLSKQQQIRFTRTEKEILRMIVQGYSSDAIAKKMFRERSTIDSHRKSILAKFHLMDDKDSEPSKNISHYIAKFNIASRLDSL